MSKLGEVLKALDTPTPANEMKYRVGNVYDKQNGKATVLSYIDSRFVQDKLDSIVGKECWSNSFFEVKGALFCTITITVDGETVSKTDCGSESDIEKAKGEASDAFKRAAVMFGIGRDLYSADALFADLESKGTWTDNEGKTNTKWVLPFGWVPNMSGEYSKPKKPAKASEFTQGKVERNMNADALKKDQGWRDRPVGFKSGNNVGKTWREIDEGTLAWVSGKECKKLDWNLYGEVEKILRQSENQSGNDITDDSKNEVIEEVKVTEDDLPF